MSDEERLLRILLRNRDMGESISPVVLAAREYLQDLFAHCETCGVPLFHDNDQMGCSEDGCYGCFGENGSGPCYGQECGLLNSDRRKPEVAAFIRAAIAKAESGASK